MVMQYPEGDKRPKNPYNPYDNHEEPQPHTSQPYCVPVPQNDQYHMHDAAVYSMWMHFVDFCLANATPCTHPDTAMCYAAVDVAVNPYARSKRLSVFRTLCNGQHVPYPGARYPAAMPPAPQREADLGLLPRQVSPENVPRTENLPANVSRPIAPARNLPPIGAPAGRAPSPSAAVPPAPAGMSPMVLTRRSSAGSPVSVTEHLRPGSEDDNNDALEEGVGVGAYLDLEDCSGSALGRDSLSRVLASPLLPSMF